MGKTSTAPTRRPTQRRRTCGTAARAVEDELTETDRCFRLAATEAGPPRLETLAQLRRTGFPWPPPLTEGECWRAALIWCWLKNAYRCEVEYTDLRRAVHAALYRAEP